MVTCRPVGVADAVPGMTTASVAGGGSLFPADDLGVSGSAHGGCPVHPSPRTAASSLPAGADADGVI